MQSSTTNFYWRGIFAKPTTLHQRNTLTGTLNRSHTLVRIAVKENANGITGGNTQKHVDTKIALVKSIQKIIQCTTQNTLPK